VRSDNFQGTPYPVLHRGGMWGCHDPENALRYLSILRAAPRQVQSGTRQVTVQDTVSQVSRNLDAFREVIGRRSAADTGAQVTERFTFGNGDQVIVDAIRTYGGEKLACVRHKGYRKDCPWLPEVILVQE
jgi:hypothetical protein